MFFFRLYVYFIYVLYLSVSVFLFEGSRNHLDLHALTHSFPTRRSSDLAGAGISRRYRGNGRAAGFGGRPLHDRADPACPLEGREINMEVKYLRSEEHTSELQSLMRISYAVFCLKKKKLYE